jgi:uncharacterized membrane protein
MDITAEQYLQHVNAELRDLPRDQAAEIVAELRSHIRDRLEGAGGAASATLPDVLAGLGDPASLAQEYRAQLLLTQARRSYRPWLVLGGTLAWARVRVKGVLVFLFALASYLTAAVCLICAALKPVFPDSVGLWAGESHVVLGFLSPRGFVTGLTLKLLPPMFVVGRAGSVQGPYTELLGYWLVPVISVVGIGLFLGSTYIIGRVIRADRGFGQRTGLRA